MQQFSGSQGPAEFISVGNLLIVKERTKMKLQTESKLKLKCTKTA